MGKRKMECGFYSMVSRSRNLLLFSAHGGVKHASWFRRVGMRHVHADGRAFGQITVQ